MEVSRLVLSSRSEAFPELVSLDPTYTLAYQGSALSSVLNYPLYFPLRSVRLTRNPEGMLADASL
jgi:hypothetical protein